MNIAVVGLGYVGSVAAACLADTGDSVICVEVNAAKVAQLNAGQSPIAEPGLAELIARNVARGRLSATADLGAAMAASSVSIICVGTPSSASGDVRLTELDRVIQEMGRALRGLSSWHLVMLTSTVPPGSTRDRVIPALERESGKVCGRDFGVAFSPEFLREGTALEDYRRPPKTVVGATDQQSLENAMSIAGRYAGHVAAAELSVAEMAKLTENAWHALKVAFTNEIGRFCACLRIDSQAVMDILKSDSRLNISTAYMTPGYAFGGSCLPKDLRTVVYRARQLGADVPVLESILPSNRLQVDAALKAIDAFAVRRVTLLGLAFKARTDDLRESPILDLAERLVGKGYDVTIHDEYVNHEKLVGANRDYVGSHYPHILSLLTDNVEVALKDAELIVVAQANPAYATLVGMIADRPVLDLCGAARALQQASNYRGLAW
jgi:GDP-mannose 6-dehydrogenase